MSAWKRSRLVVAVLGLAGVPSTAPGGEAPEPAPPPAARPNKEVELRVSPSPAPVPALKYRLLPLEPDRTPGDAAPIYIRLGLGMSDAARKEVADKPTAWLDLPLKDFPAAEARKFVDLWAGKLEQIGFGARRQSCQWNYPLAEQKETVYEIVMPDAMVIRDWARVLAVKARVEVAEHKYGEAVRTLETGLAFSRHIGEGPFVINALIGVACAQIMLARLEELCAQPGAPNLYWALTALPRPLIGLRTAMENEQKQVEWLVPEISDLDRTRTGAEWSALLGRLHARLMRLQKSAVAVEGKVVEVGRETTLEQFRAENLPDARAHFKGRGRPTEGMSDDQLVMISIAERYRELRDDLSRLYYLPYPDAAAYDAETRERVTAFEKGPVGIFAELILTTVLPVKIAETRADRRVAALRVVEALRMHADANGGRLPGSLDEVKVVPVPLDPMTAKPFDYRREGETAVLSGAAPRPDQPGLTYRVTLRK